MKQTEMVLRQLDDKIIRLEVLTGELKVMSEKVRQILEEVETQADGR